MRNLVLCWMAIGILSPARFLHAQGSIAPLPSRCKPGKPISSQRSKEAVIELSNEHGHFTGGDNAFCLDFRRAQKGGLVDVGTVSVEFSQLVGKIEERPIMAQLSHDSVGTYLGHVDLGRQFYKPAAYYAVVHYVDLGGKKRKARLLLEVQ